jgi:hypothetical protein
MTPDANRTELIIALRMTSNHFDVKQRDRSLSVTSNSSFEKRSVESSSLDNGHIEKRTIFGSYWSSDVQHIHKYERRSPSLLLDPNSLNLIDRAITTSQTLINGTDTNASAFSPRITERRSIIFQRRRSISVSTLPENEVVINKRRTLSDSTLVVPLKSCLRRGRFSCKQELMTDDSTILKSFSPSTSVRFNFCPDVVEYEKPSEFWGSDNWTNYFE